MAEISKLKFVTAPAELLGAEADMVCGPDGCMLPETLIAPIERNTKAGTAASPRADEQAVPVRKA